MSSDREVTPEQPLKRVVPNTVIDIRRPGDLEAYSLTGRKESTALLWSTVPDGERRLVGILSRECLEQILERWPG